MNTPNLLVIGGTGFIGHHLLKSVKQKGWEVTSVSLKPPTEQRFVDGVRYLHFDMADQSLVKKYPNIKYLAISNVESDKVIKKFISLFGEKVKIVPKIETIRGVKNISNITDSLPYSKKILMLDHDDLFVDVSKSNHSPDFFKELVNNLISFCKSNEIKLLRVRGIIFSDSIIYDTML